MTSTQTKLCQVSGSLSATPMRENLPLNKNSALRSKIERSLQKEGRAQESPNLDRKNADSPRIKRPGSSKLQYSRSCNAFDLKSAGSRHRENYLQVPKEPNITAVPSIVEPSKSTAGQNLTVDKSLKFRDPFPFPLISTKYGSFPL